MACDEYVRKIKGKKRPVIGENDRALTVATLRLVDIAFIDKTLARPDEVKTNARILKKINPHYVVIETGTDNWKQKRKAALDAKTDVIMVNIPELETTTDIIRRIS